MSTDQHPLYGKKQPTNLLFMHEGRKNWQREHVLNTPGDREIENADGTTTKVKSLDRRETPADKMQVSNLGADVAPVNPFDTEHCKAVVSPEYCPGCDKYFDLDNAKTPGGGAGLWCFMQDYPGLVAMGDNVTYFKCEPCFSKKFSPLQGQRRLVLPNNGWSRYDAGSVLQTEENIVNYLRANRQNPKVWPNG